MRALLAAVLALAPQQAEGPAERLGVARGVCAVLGDAEAALRLARTTELVIYLQLEGEAGVEDARRAAEAAGIYGTRLYVEPGDSKRIHLADNLADALIAADAAVPEAEALRVVRPRGRAILGAKVLVRPWPEGMGDWSHPHHGPDNNPYSEDRAARAPFLTQFVQGPRNAPVPQITVGSAGRLFKLYGHLGLKAGTEGLVNTMVALNGFNGTVLWRHPLRPGFMPHRSTLIASPSTVYVGDDVSCRLLDAATGKEAGEIAAPEGADGPVWKWMGMEGGVLYALLGPREEEAPEVRSKGGFGYGFGWPEVGKGFHSRDFPWQQGRTLAAIDTATRKVLVFGSLTSTWPAATNIVVEEGVAYAAAGMFYHDGTHVVALDAESGRLRWRNGSSGRLNADVNAGVSVGGQMLLREGKLYLAGGSYLSPGIYDAATGACLNASSGKYSAGKGNTAGAWGWKLLPEGEGVKVSGPPFYGFEGPILAPAAIVGHAVDRDGRTVVVRREGQVLAYPSRD